MAASAPASPKRQPSVLNKTYLILYNFASAVAWSVVLGRTVSLLSQSGPQSVYAGVGEWTKWTQTVAAMEILHSLLGTFCDCFSSVLSPNPTANLESSVPQASSALLSSPRSPRSHRASSSSGLSSTCSPSSPFSPGTRPCSLPGPSPRSSATPSLP